jgi:glycosyltransferase involved in cell wall biosynthesis
VNEPSVLQIITRLNVGGSARHVIQMSSLLARRGWPCEVATGTVGDREGELGTGDVPMVRIPHLQRSIDPVADVRAARRLWEVVTHLRPAIVNTHLAKAGALGRLAARRAGVPVIVHTYHGHVLAGYFPGWAERAFATAERMLAARTDALIAVSAEIRDDLLRLGIGRPSQWHVIPLGVDVAVVEGADRSAARAALGLPDSAPVIGIVGRLVPIKGHDTFIRAARLVSLEVPDAVFVVAGDGELRHSLEREAGRLLGERVRFLGWHEDVRTLYASLDVVVLTSRNEGTPMSLLEAAAASRPVVATKVGGVRDVVRDGMTGILVAPGDDGGIAAGVIRLLQRQDRGRAIGEEARRWVTERFAVERVADRTIDLYRELLVRARR